MKYLKGTVLLIQLWGSSRASHLLHWSDCVQKHWDHDKTKCTSPYDDLECMDKIEDIGDKNCIDGYKTHVDVCCRKDDKVCSFSCVPPESDELISKTPLKRSELMEMVQSKIKEHDNLDDLKVYVNVKMTEKTSDLQNIMLISIAAIFTVFLIQFCGFMVYLRQVKKERKQLYLNCPEDIEKSYTIPTESKQQPQNQPFEAQIIKPKEDLIRENIQDSEINILYKTEASLAPMVPVIEENRVEQQETDMDLQTQNPLQDDILKTAEDIAQCPQDIKFDRDEWFKNKLELNDISKNLEVKNSQQVTDRSKNELSNLNMSLTCSNIEDPVNLKQSIVSPNIYDQRVPESKMTKKTISLCNSLNIDLSNMNDLKKDKIQKPFNRPNIPRDSNKKLRSLRYSTLENKSKEDKKFKQVQVVQSAAMSSNELSERRNTVELMDQNIENQDQKLFIDTNQSFYAAQMLAERPSKTSLRQSNTVKASSRRSRNASVKSTPSASKIMFIKQVYNQNLKNQSKKNPLAVVIQKPQNTQVQVSPRLIDKDPIGEIQSSPRTVKSTLNRHDDSQGQKSQIEYDNRSVESLENVVNGIVSAQRTNRSREYQQGD